MSVSVNFQQFTPPQVAAIKSLISAAPLTNLFVASTGINQAILHWTSEQGLDYKVFWKQNGQTNWIEAGNTDKSIFKVVGLTENTAYDFAIQTDNGIVKSEFSNIATATTKPNLPLFQKKTLVNVAGATTTQVVVLTDNTNLYLNDLTGVNPPAIVLNAGEVYSFSSSQFDTISFDADKSAYAAGKVNNSCVTWQPAYLAGKQFAFGTRRRDPQSLKIWAIETSVVEIFEGDTLINSANIPQNTGTTITWGLGSGDKSLKVISTGLIIAFQHANNYTDSRALMPIAPEIIGVPSNSGKLFTSLEVVNAISYRSDGIQEDLIIIDGGVTQISGTGSLYAGAATKIKCIDGAITGMSSGDGNGSSAASFLPTAFMSSLGGIPYDTDYVAFMSDEPLEIDLFDENGSAVGIGSFSLSGSNGCYKERLNNLPAGTVFKARNNQKFYYVWQELTSNDETSGIVFPD